MLKELINKFRSNYHRYMIEELETNTVLYRPTIKEAMEVVNFFYRVSNSSLRLTDLHSGTWTEYVRNPKDGSAVGPLKHPHTIYNKERI